MHYNINDSAESAQKIKKYKRGIFMKIKRIIAGILVAATCGLATVSYTHLYQVDEIFAYHIATLVIEIALCGIGSVITEQLAACAEEEACLIPAVICIESEVCCNAVDILRHNAFDRLYIILCQLGLVVVHKVGIGYIRVAVKLAVYRSR